MVYGSCVKLHDFFDGSNKLLDDFFFNFINFLVIVPIVAEEKQGHIENQH